MTDLSITQGDAKSYNLTFDTAGTPLNITGATVTMTVKRKLSDATPAIRKAVTSHTDAANGQTTITLSAADTDIALGVYYYDIEITGGPVDTTTVLKGKLTVGWQATESS